jgi:hypothetical protein
MVIVGSVHVYVLVCYLFLKRPKIGISEIFRFLLRLLWRLEAKKENDQNKDDWSDAHGFLDHRQKIAAARMPSRTPSSGLDRANQNETFQPEPFTVLFVFTLFSQAFEDRHFRRREVSWPKTP